MTAAVLSPPTAPSRRAGSRELTVLSVGQLLAWGAAFYTFSGTLAPLLAATGWSPTSVSAGFTAGQLVSALAAPAVGSMLERRGPRAVFVPSALLLGLALVAAGLAAGEVMFTVALGVVGAVSGGALLLPAFATVTAWFPQNRVRALSAVSIAAAASAMVVSPLVGVVVTGLGWRAAYLCAGALCVAVLVPMYLLGLRAPWPAAAQATPEQPGGTAAAPQARWATRRREFWILAVGLAVGALLSNVTLICAAPLATERGLGYGTGIAALTANGAGAVVGRLLFTPLIRRIGQRRLAVVVFALAAVQTAALGLLGTNEVLVIGLTSVAGLARGVFALFQGTFAVAQWGPSGYSVLNSSMNGPAVATMAGSALIGTSAASVSDYGTVFVLLALPAALIAAVIALTRRRLLSRPLHSTATS